MVGWAQEPPTPVDVSVLYCDAALFVVDKPSGLPVHPVSRYCEGTVVGRLRQRLGHGFAAPVHRLDRETSGVLLCARTRQMAAALTKLFLTGGIRKDYLAICHGAPCAQTFSVEAPIGQGAAVVRIGVHIASAHLGQPARTDFSLVTSFVRNNAPYSVWRARPHTGRRHQIRVHLRHAGLPLVGDKIYGTDEALYERFCDHALTEADWRLLQLPRHALHAQALSFVHPFSGETMRFEAPVPSDLRAFCGAQALHVEGCRL